MFWALYGEDAVSECARHGICVFNRIHFNEGDFAHYFIEKII